MLGWGGGLLDFSWLGLFFLGLDWSGFHFFLGGFFVAFFLRIVGFSFLDVLGENLIILCLGFFGGLVAFNLLSLLESLSSESLFGDESLDLWRFVEGLVSLLDFSSDDVLSHIIGLSQGEDLSNVVGSLGAESSGLITIGDSFDFSITLLDDLEGNNGKVWAADATSDRLSLSLSSSSGSVGSCS